MTQPLMIQILGVSHRRDDHGHEGLVYAPAPLLNEGRVALEPAWKPIKSEVLTRHLEDVRRRVDELSWRARSGQSRGTLAIEPPADALARYLLPGTGLIGLIGPGLQPQFDIVFDIASLVPWEVLEERYTVCSCRPDRYVCIPQGDQVPQHCQHCGRLMEQGGGKLAVERHLTHLVRGGQLISGSGNVFLLVEDPTQDLCADDQPDVCRGHVRQLHQMLAKRGYQVDVLRGSQATTRQLLEALERPEVEGLYYFGHGFFPSQGDQGCLVLADGLLYAEEIERVVAQPRFVFLNTCEGAAAGRDWSLDRRFRSVGHALARGGPRKTVIAPLWPVCNHQAAATALAFFQEALRGASLGVAMQNARRSSLRRYEQGEADISWMAYRFYGDPGRTLPSPTETTIRSAQSRVFVDHRLDADRFGFNFRDVLLRAAKHRNLQRRAHVTPLDLLVGLIRCGELTRYILRSLGGEPDALYEQFQRAAAAGEDPGPAAGGSPHAEAESPAEAATLLLQWLTRLVVRQEEHFTPECCAVLRRADQLACERSDHDHVSEHDVLDALTAAGHWQLEAGVSLPAAAEIRRLLDRRARDGAVDENGGLVLPKLAPLGRRIVEAAHEMSQQRGSPHVANRLLLAAFLSEADSSASTACRAHGADPTLVAALLSAGMESRPPLSYGLSPESAGRSVLPMLERARALHGDQATPVTDAELFLAFCQVAPAELKQGLCRLPPPLELDLDQLGALVERTLRQPVAPRPNKSAPRGGAPKPARAESTVKSNGHADVASLFPGVKPASSTGDTFSAEVQEALSLAQQFALIQGYTDVRSIHLAAGLVCLRSAWVVRILEEHHLTPERLCLGLLRVVLPKALAADEPLQMSWSKNTLQILRSAAQMSAGEPADGRAVWRAILADSSGIVVQVLKQAGLWESFVQSARDA